MLQRIYNFFAAIQEATSPRYPNPYGWVPQFPDHRDFLYRLRGPSVEFLLTLPDFIDLRSQLPPVWDQGNIGSSVAHAIADATYLCKGFLPSRLDLYYQARARVHQTSYDAGCSIRSMLKAISNEGVLSESHYPYKEWKFRCKPPTEGRVTLSSYTYFALDHQNLSDLKRCLASGHPFFFGLSAHRAFDSVKMERDGLLSNPIYNEEILGGLCVLCVGYDDSDQQFILRNSWGSSWGQEGYFKAPYSYLTNPKLVSDFWTIRT